MAIVVNITCLRREDLQVPVQWLTLLLLTLWTSNYFCQTPVGARLIFSMLLLGAELIFANLPAGAGLFFEPEKRRDPLQALMPVTK